MKMTIAAQCEWMLVSYWQAAHTCSNRMFFERGLDPTPYNQEDMSPQARAQTCHGSEPSTGGGAPKLGHRWQAMLVTKS